MPTLMGRYKVPHFDAKGESDQFFKGLPVTNLLTTFYWDNLIGMAPKKGPDGTLVFTLPMGDKKIAGIVAEDIGKCAYGIFKRGQEFIGKTIGIASELLTGTQIAAALAAALGREVRYNPVTPAVFRGFGFPGAADLGNMFQFYAEFESHFAETRDVALARVAQSVAADAGPVARRQREPHPHRMSSRPPEPRDDGGEVAAAVVMTLATMAATTLAATTTAATTLDVTTPAPRPTRAGSPPRTRHACTTA